MDRGFSEGVLEADPFTSLNLLREMEFVSAKRP
jgi:hypothetical protein